MTVEQMAREVVDLWTGIGGPCDPSIEDCCYQLYGHLDSFWFSLVEEKANEIADDESYRFAFQCTRPATGPHARPGA